MIQIVVKRQYPIEYVISTMRPSERENNMAKAKGGLGRGLDSLISNAVDSSSSDRLTTVAIADIQPGRYQARVQIDDEALQELADSIKAQGIIQPVIVRERGLSQYELIAGERRWRASQLAGLTEIPVVIKTISDETALAMGLIENLQRHDLNALETATAYQKLRDQFNMTLEEIGKRLGGKSISAVSNTLRLLKLPKSVQQALFEGRLNEGQARPLIGLPDDAAEDIMERAIREEWSARRIEQVVTLWKQAKASPIENKRRPADMPHADAIESLEISSKFSSPSSKTI